MLIFANIVIRPFATIELTFVLVYLVCLSVKQEDCINNLFIEINALSNR